MIDADKILIDLWYGDESQKLELSQAMGGGDSYSICIDNYYCGAIVNYCSGWKVVWANDGPECWTAFEQDELLEMLFEHWKRTGHENYEEMLTQRRTLFWRAGLGLEIAYKNSMSSITLRTPSFNSGPM